MKFYKNEEHNDLLIVEGERCVIHFLSLADSLIEIAKAEGLDVIDAVGETLDDKRDEDESPLTYRELIANGFYTEVEM